MLAQSPCWISRTLSWWKTWCWFLWNGQLSLPHTCRRNGSFQAQVKRWRPGNASHLDFSAVSSGHLVPFAQPWHSLASHKQCEPHVDWESEATCPNSHVQNLLSQVIQHVLPSQPDNISSSTLFPAVKWASIPLFLYPIPWPRLQHKLQVPPANKFNTSSFGNGWGNYLPGAFAGI